MRRGNQDLKEHRRNWGVSIHILLLNITQQQTKGHGCSLDTWPEGEEDKEDVEEEEGSLDTLILPTRKLPLQV